VNFFRFFFQAGDEVYMMLDCEENSLSFMLNEIHLGPAFIGLPKIRLYPAASTVYGNTEISLLYLGPPQGQCVIKKVCK